jgi:hypothetical protein
MELLRQVDEAEELFRTTKTSQSINTKTTKSVCYFIGGSEVNTFVLIL